MQFKTTFDVAVVGVGAMGSAALLQLARRNISVCGIEQFNPGHALGSSHGDSRMIREAYFEHPNYVPLVRRAYQAWRDLERETDQKLLVTPGVLMVGAADSLVLKGMQKSAELHGIELEYLDRLECIRRFPGMVIPNGMTAIFEPGAGYVHVERAVKAQAELALRYGAKLFAEERVIAMERKPDSILIRTDRQTIQVARVIVAGGPWSQNLLAELNLPLQLHKVMMFWFKTAPGHSATSPQIGFGFDLKEGFFYGLPQVSPWGIKLGKHKAEEPVADPATIDRSISRSQLDSINHFTRLHLPMLDPQLSHHATCMYTMTPDEDFIIDQHPQDPRVVFAAGFSGHGFKFAPAVGEILADLLLQGSTHLPCQFLQLGQRFRQSR